MNRKSLVRKVLIALVAPLALLSSCSTPMNITYMQDSNPGVTETVEQPLNITVKPGDKISIVVKSKDPELSDLFNLPTVSYRVGQGATSSLSSSSQQVQTYLVNDEGNVDFPIIGAIHVQGLKRDEISKLVKEKLIAKNLVKDPVVTVDYDNLSYSVLGEVKDPGQFVIDRDRVTIYDAIAKAGDMTIYGDRKDVKVRRRNGDKIKVYSLDLTSDSALLKSPAYCLQQNDVVYVAPNDTRQRQSTVNGNNVRSTSFWLSFSSLMATIAAVIISVVK